MGKQLTATVDDLLLWEPCSDWSEGRIRELAGAKQRWTALDVLDLPIQDDAKLWVVLRPALIAEPVLHELACRFAEEVLPIYERECPKDTNPRDAITAKRAWLRGEITDEQLAAARAAAWDAAWDAACAAARDAARAAAGFAARDAARAKQVEIVRKALVGEE